MGLIYYTVWISLYYKIILILSFLKLKQWNFSKIVPKCRQNIPFSNTKIFMQWTLVKPMHRHSFRLDRLDFPQVILENSDVISKNAEQNYFLFSLTRWLCICYISDCQCVFDFKQNIYKVSSFFILFLNPSLT